MQNCEATKSTHKAEVIRLEKIEPHPNADRLDVVQVWGYQCCVAKGQFKEGDLAVYVVPDSCVDVRKPEFTFLADQAKSSGKARIKAKKLRGVVSYGLLIPAPEGSTAGDDLAESLGVERYEPQESNEGGGFVVSGDEEDGPEFNTGPGKYDVDSFERYAHLVFEDGQDVFISEKLDGSNARFTFWDGRFWVKSRSRWVKRTADYSHITVESLIAKGCAEEKAKEVVERLAEKVTRGVPTNGFWEAMESTPALMEYLQRNPGTVVFGEVYGNVNRIKYGLPQGNSFAAFDIYRDGSFLSAPEALAEARDNGFSWVPHFHDAHRPEPIKYSFELVKTMSEGHTTVSGAKDGTIREGVVVRSWDERWHPSIGRVQLKCVSPAFLEK